MPTDGSCCRLLPVETAAGADQAPPAVPRSDTISSSPAPDPPASQASTAAPEGFSAKSAVPLTAPVASRMAVVQVPPLGRSVVHNDAPSAASEVAKTAVARPPPVTPSPTDAGWSPCQPPIVVAEAAAPPPTSAEAGTQPASPSARLSPTPSKATRRDT
jgi:hypothetical protein